MKTPNSTYLGELVTGLVILAKSVPETLTDANGDQIAAGLMQTAHDLDAELGLGREVNWSAQGEPADVLPVDRMSLARLRFAANTINMLLDSVPGGDNDD